jgi:hypothetical protein
MTTKRISVNNWIITLEEDPATGDVILPLNDEILELTGWQLGDTLVWEVVYTDGKPTATVRKKE